MSSPATLIRGRRLLAIATALATLGAAVAVAYFTAAGSGTAGASVGTLSAPAISVPATSTGTTTITWTQQASVAPALDTAIAYTVERRLGAGSYAAVASGGCAGPLPHGTTSCVDTVTASGSYTYRVVARFKTWTATSDEAGPVATDTVVPTVQSITRHDASPTNASSVSFDVAFSESVAGVDATDFALVATGVTGASITSVTGGAASYTVTVATGAGSGTLWLNLVDNDSITDSVGNALGGPGTIGPGDGSFTGPAYTFDRTAPSVQSVVRADADPTNAAIVHWTVTFSEAVTGVDATDVALASGGLVAGASISGVTGSGTTYTVTASTGSGNGSLGLNVVDNDSIVDGVGNALGGAGAGNGGYTGPAYTVDKTAPTVLSIDRADASPTAAGTVHWSVTFTESVSGVDATDLALVASGVSGASITNVSGSGASYAVTVNSGSGTGTLGLNLADDDTIHDAAGTALGGTGAGNGSFTGQAYTFDRTAPVVQSVVRASTDPTKASSVNWTVTFSESVSGVEAGDFQLASTGVSGASISSVTGSGASYTVTATTGTGSGSLGLNVLDDDSIVDGVGNRLGGPGTGNGAFTGQAYTIDRTAPTVASINRHDPNPTNASSVQFDVTFSESVTGVGSSDFVLATTGLTGTSITGVSGGGAAYIVTASTGTGASGTIALNLVDDDSIADGLGTPLGGAGAGNGNFSGQSYTIDRTAPTGSTIDATPNASGNGKVDSGDTVVFTYSEAMAPASILASWDGTTRAVAIIGGNDNGSAGNDSLAVSGANLGSLDLGDKNFMTAPAPQWSGTIVQSPDGKTVTLTVGACTSTPCNAGTLGGSGKTTLKWTPSASATDLAGNGVSAALVTQGVSGGKKNF